MKCGIQISKYQQEQYYTAQNNNDKWRIHMNHELIGRRDSVWFIKQQGSGCSGIW